MSGNGRVYDPVMGMFLSPDNFVQEPGNSQNFNRYAYCLNNPLIYIDPDGENPLIVILAVVGAYLGGVSSNDLELNFLKWNWHDESTYLSIAFGTAAGALGGYGLVNPGTVNFSYSLITPVAQLGIEGYKNDWDFKWTTAAGGSGKIPLREESPKMSVSNRTNNNIRNMNSW